MSWHRSRHNILSPLDQDVLDAVLREPQTPLLLRQLRDVSNVYCSRGWDVPACLIGTLNAPG